MVRIRKTLIAAAVVTAACAAPAAGAVEVVATIKPVHSLVAAVMQGVGEPHLIVRDGGSPHTYAMRPSDAAALRDAEVVFWVGPNLEVFLVDSLHAIAGKATVVGLGGVAGVESLPMREGGTFDDQDHDAEEHEAGEGEAHDTAEHEHEHEHEGPDPHVWLDPMNAKAMVSAIADTLAAADPSRAGVFRANAAALTGRLDALVAEVDADLAAVRGRPFVVFHDAYQYFERRFRIAAAGSITVSPDVMPGARRLTEVRDKVRGLGAVCVFSEPQFEPRLIGVVTEVTAAGTGILDPLGAALADGPQLYETLIRDMAAALKACLAASG